MANLKPMRNALLLFFLFFTGSLSAQTADEYYTKATADFNASNFSRGLKYINKAIEADSMNENYYLLKAQCQQGQKEYQAAYATYSAAIFKLPESFLLYEHRGLFLYYSNHFEESLSDFKVTLLLAKNDSLKLLALQNLSCSRMAIRDFSGAYQDLMTGMAIDSNHIGMLANLGVVCDEIGKGDETLKYLLRIIAIDSSNIAALINIGYKYQRMERHTKAISYFDKVIAIDPKEGYAYSNRAYSKLMSGDTKGALADANKAIALRPGNPYAYRNRALIYLKMDKREKACDDIQTALDRGFTGQYGNEVKQLKRDYCPATR